MEKNNELIQNALIQIFSDQIQGIINLQDGLLKMKKNDNFQKEFLQCLNQISIFVIKQIQNQFHDKALKVLHLLNKMIDDKDLGFNKNHKIRVYIDLIYIYKRQKNYIKAKNFIHQARQIYFQSKTTFLKFVIDLLEIEINYLNSNQILAFEQSKNILQEIETYYEQQSIQKQKQIFYVYMIALFNRAQITESFQMNDQSQKLYQQSLNICSLHLGDKNKIYQLIKNKNKGNQLDNSSVLSCKSVDDFKIQQLKQIYNQKGSKKTVGIKILSIFSDLNLLNDFIQNQERKSQQINVYYEKTQESDNQSKKISIKKSVSPYQQKIIFTQNEFHKQKFIRQRYYSTKDCTQYKQTINSLQKQQNENNQSVRTLKVKRQISVCSQQSLNKTNNSQIFKNASNHQDQFVNITRNSKTQESLNKKYKKNQFEKSILQKQNQDQNIQVKKSRKILFEETINDYDSKKQKKQQQKSEIKKEKKLQIEQKYLDAALIIFKSIKYFQSNKKIHFNFDEKKISVIKKNILILDDQKNKHLGMIEVIYYKNIIIFIFRKRFTMHFKINKLDLTGQQQIIKLSQELFFNFRKLITFKPNIRLQISNKIFGIFQQIRYKFQFQIEILTA